MVHDLEVKWRSYGCLKTSAKSWVGISQLRGHLEGCFAAAKPLFGTRVPFCSTVPLISKLRNGCEMGCDNISPLRNHLWAAKSPLSFEMAAKWSPSFEMAAKSSPSFEMVAKSSPSFEMAAKSPPIFKMAFKLRNWLAKWRKVCKNTLQSQGKLLKCQQSPATMHLKRRAPRTLGSHTLSLSLHF